MKLKNLLCKNGESAGNALHTSDRFSFATVVVAKIYNQPQDQGWLGQVLTANH